MTLESADVDLRHPYTKIEFDEEELGVTRKTASQYLKQLVEKDYLKLLKIGRSNFYLNAPLFDLLLEPDTVEMERQKLLLLSRYE